MEAAHLTACRMCSTALSRAMSIRPTSCDILPSAFLAQDSQGTHFNSRCNAGQSCTVVGKKGIDHKEPCNNLFFFTKSPTHLEQLPLHKFTISPAITSVPNLQHVSESHSSPSLPKTARFDLRHEIQISHSYATRARTLVAPRPVQLDSLAVRG